MDFADLVAPLSADQFLTEHYGRAPLHIPAPPGSNRCKVLDWAGLNALLGIQRHWSPENIRLMRNGKAIAQDLYMERVIAQEGPIERASPEKIDVFLATGASLVGQSVQQISPDLREFGAMLAERLRGRVTVTLFCSFEGVAAFPKHFDSHEVFAIQCEGEKTWRIYAPRVDQPLHGTRYHETGGAEDAEAEILMTVHMRPGDVLYIPRGYSHEALASAAASLHVSFSVDPPSGPVFFKLLKEAALHDSAFRAYLADARADDGAALRAHLDDLAQRLAAIVRSPAFFDEVATSQQSLVRRPHLTNLPHRPRLDFYVRSGREARLVRTGEGAMLSLGKPDGELAVGSLREEVEWILAHPMFSLQELGAHFPHRPHEVIATLLAKLEEADILRGAAQRS